MPERPPRRTVVVGAGVAGLTAARDLAAAGREVLVLEGSPDIGGKLRSASVAGVTVDVGAESMLARRPEGVDLARGLGLPVVHPAATSSSVWTRGALRPLPRSVMGVPADVDQVAASGVLSDSGVERLRHETARHIPRRRRGRLRRRAGGLPARRRGRGPAGRAPARWRVRRPRPPAVRAGDRAAVVGVERGTVPGRRRRAHRRGHVRSGVRRDRGRSRPAAAAPWPTVSTSAPARRCEDCVVRRRASCWSSDRPPMPRRCSPTRSCSPHRRLRAPGSSPRSRRTQPRSSRRSSTPRWPS